ncbi:hypothetical protein C4552_02210 [Candidatus Parcubacteria bacterium]|nr:MAG: hypothetical protein C4552_02210 [Candidatus Parcubacteria bacterium]
MGSSLIREEGAMVIRIVVLSGRSGVGKTTIMRRLLEHPEPKFRPFLSTTTRLQRPTDAGDDYEYCTNPAFDEFDEQGEFVWVKSFGGYRYGGRRRNINACLRGSAVSVMALTPDIVPRLKGYVRESGIHDSVWSVYLTAPDDVLLRRMEKRGDSAAEIRDRFDACRAWDADARRLECFDECLVNDDEEVPGAAVSAAIIRRVLESYRYLWGVRA